ncbi:MAG: ribonuclease III domain-containing protein [Anaerostipes sp.]|jgi:ribonuclease-3 family protein|nr:ribonuclease III domain-containing protein [Anaerostipes sp.]MDD3744873.1 ribonuclease III domain-containing protein [Anaerostipes sp.]
MEKSLVEQISESLDLKSMDPRTYSPLGLAYIGDGIYEIVIRTLVISKGNMSVNKYHHASSEYVKAAAQAQLYKEIEDILTEEEMAVYKRGRNAKSVTMAKNATMADYRMATGVEALMGFLYLSGNEQRIIELVKKGFKIGE